MDRPENALVELLVVHNKTDAALAAGLRDEEPRAAPCRWSRNLCDDVLLQEPNSPMRLVTSRAYDASYSNPKKEDQNNLKKELSFHLSPFGPSEIL